MLEPGIEAVRTVGLYPLVLPILRVVVGNPPPLAAAPSAGGPGGGGGGASGLGSHGSRASVCVCVEAWSQVEVEAAQGLRFPRVMCFPGEPLD
jgi:hypothetical protein